MKIKGQLIKMSRTQKKISQKELSEGICTQATISNIEKKNTCDSIDILNKICQRLEMDMITLFYADNEETIREAVEKVKQLCEKGENKKAYELIMPLKDTEIVNPLLRTAFFYYVGLVYFLEKNNESEMLFYLHLATDTLANNTIYRSLSYCLLGQFYDEHGEMDKAKMQYKKSLQILKQLTVPTPKEGIHIYYQIGKYFRTVDNYEVAKSILNEGLALNRSLDTMYLLENQLYELALCESKEDASFQDCLAIAQFKQNKPLIREILSKNGLPLK